MAIFDFNARPRLQAASREGAPALSDTHTLDGLYRRHHKEICVFIKKSFGAGPPDPEDAAQAAFTQFAALKNPREVENPRAFLFRSARNFVLDYRRRLLTQMRYAGDACENFAEPSAQQDQLRVLEGKERLAAVLAAVRTLEPRRRKVLIWHAFHELTFNEIAQRLGLSQARVRQLFADAIRVCEAASRRVDLEGEGR